MTMENEQTPATVIPNGQVPTQTEAIPVEAPPVEGAPKAEAAEAKPDDKFSQKFALLSKKEREIQLKEKQLNEKISKYGTVEEIQKLLETDPTGAFERLGTTYEKIVDKIIENPKKATTEIDLLRKEVEETKKMLAAEKAAKEETERQKSVATYKSAQKEFILGAKDKYELINAFDEWDLVYDTATEYYETHKEIPTHEQIADMVEAHLEKTTNPLLEKVLQTKKFGHFAKPKDEPKAESQEVQSLPGKSQTLTNNMSQTVTNPGADKYLTAEERLQKALSMLR